MGSLPAAYITILFTLTVLATAGFLLYALWTAHRKRSLIYLSAVLLAAWMLLQGYLAETAFYTTLDGRPRFVLAVAPALLLIVSLFFFRRSRDFLGRISLFVLTLLSVVRLPVELVIHWWHLNGLVPQLMTFEGRNFDIISGITAPIVAFLVFSKGAHLSRVSLWKRRLLFGWNVACLLLLINIVANAVVSIPSPIQQQAFDQPNVAVLYYPFIWLPAVIVPAVLFSHLVSMYQLLFKNDAD